MKNNYANSYPELAFLSKILYTVGYFVARPFFYLYVDFAYVFAYDAESHK